jgi:methionine-rich copper-binding protein CopC
MTCLPRYRPTTAGRRLPLLESLECRQLLSGANLPPGITAVQLEPSAGAGQELVISFDQHYVDAISTQFPIDFATVINGIDGNNDFQLDGPSGVVFGFGDAPAVENVSTNSTSTDVIIPINGSLPAGTYQVSLNWGSALDNVMSNLDSLPTGTFWTSLVNSSTPVTIAQLTVQSNAGAKLSDATDLGLIGPTIQNEWGTLDPDKVASAVDLYKFTLAPGQIWELGVSISTQSIGSQLFTTVSLFDSNGILLADRNAGEGLPSDPDDPYLFAGLTPTPQAETYYIGVSSYGNTPYGTQGYDPVKGIPGTLGLSQPGGPFPFELNVTAQPHDQASQLVGFSLAHADNLDPSPTSMTLTFSGPIDVSSIFVPDRQETALDVVDSSGRTWPVTAESYQPNDAQLTVIFDTPLPAGQYSLIIPASGGLTDLAGAPVFATGKPAGVLASWTVGVAGPENLNDLGVLWPSKAGVVWPTGNGSFAETTALAPGQEQTYRWVVIVPGTYTLQTQVVGSSIEVVNSWGASATVLDAGSTNGLNNYLMTLAAGVYELRLTNVGSQQAEVHWLMKIASLDWEKIVDNGVSQSSALSLMTFSGPAAGPDTGTGLFSIPASVVGPAMGGSAGQVPASLLVTLNTGLTGQPSWDGQATSGAGLMADPGAIATVGGPTGQALATGFNSLYASEDGQANDNMDMIERPGTVTVADGKQISAIPETVQARSGPDDASSLADVHALAESDWVVRIGSLVQDWFAYSRPDGPAHPSMDGSVAPTLTAGAQPELLVKEPVASWQNRHFTPMLRSDIGGAAGIIMVGAVAYRMTQPVRTWWRARGQLNFPGPLPRARVLLGPHRIAKNSRLKTRVRGS